MSAPTSSPATAATAASDRTLAEPASLTQISSRAAAKCPSCAGTRLTKLSLVLTDGSPVDFTSCHTCEHKSWEQDGAVLPVEKVLAKARKPR